MTDLLSLSPPELILFLRQLSEPAYRARQLFGWLQRGRAFAQMSNLPKALRQRLAEIAVPCGVRIDAVRASERDDTRKFLFGMMDGQQVEGVLMRYHFGYTLCVSTQVGCRMGCAFCASTLEGRVRDLTAGEILGQVVCVERLLEEEAQEAGEARACAQNVHADTANAAGTSGATQTPPARRITNVVLMGSGEPLDNYEETIRFIRLISHPDGIHFSPRNISVSTCGLIEGIDRLRGEELPLTLCISLHAPNDEIRREIMPIAKTVSMAELLDACRRWTQTTGRRVIFEYALIAGVNDGIPQADELSARLRGLSAHVNLIPLNPVPERSLTGTKEKTVRDFCARLEKNGISATIRREMGTDIEGACGQLRRKARKDMEARP